MIESVKKTISDYKMLEPQDRVLVGLSGGADSICLCLVLKLLGYTVGAAHVNHILRAEADGDEKFSNEFCHRHNIDFYSIKVDVSRLSKEMSVSTESAGRDIRYKYFNEIAEKHNYNKIAVAHNKNDCAETLLFNLIRGAGLKGLCSIPAVRDNIVRPLIDTDRVEIENFLTKQGEAFVTDKTNLECDYSRNKIRNLILPEILKLNDKFIENAKKTSEVLSVDNNFINQYAESYVNFEGENAFIYKNDFFKMHSAVKARCIFIAYEFIAGTSKDLEKRHVDYIINNVFEKTHKNIIDLGFNVTCRAEYDKIIFKKRINDNYFEYLISSNEQVDVIEANMKITAEIVDRNCVHFCENTEYFDIKEMKFPIKIRSIRNGDRMVPLGMRNSKKINEIFIDLKISVEQRKKVPIIEAENIICALGVKRSALYTINDNTEKILMIKGEKLC